MQNRNTQLDLAFAALAHETRRALLEQLAGGAMRVTEIAAPFDLSLNTISKHLRVLEEAGLVTRRIEGRDHWIEADLSAIDPGLSWIDRQRRYWTERREAYRQIVEAAPQQSKKRSKPHGRRRRTR
ncbi:MAG: metalloregulator ArsR/SmtB family transcription factor [Dongiaceae bacterium]